MEFVFESPHAYHLQKNIFLSAQIGFEQVRRKAGLPKRKLFFPFDETPLRLPTPILCAWSGSILPASTDWTYPRVHVTGYYFNSLESASSLAQSQEQAPALQNFLKSDKPPVCHFVWKHGQQRCKKN
ncbi:MAG: hypothetical protein HC797_02655 [Anaerolineales bacterium]|nr:hypothetical protein [Anaerolineales bacterium]